MYGNATKYNFELKELRHSLRPTKCEKLNFYLPLRSDDVYFEEFTDAHTETIFHPEELL